MATPDTVYAERSAFFTIGGGVVVTLMLALLLGRCSYEQDMARQCIQLGAVVLDNKVFDCILREE